MLLPQGLSLMNNMRDHGFVNIMKVNSIVSGFFVVVLLFFAACSDKDDPEPENEQKIIFNFDQHIDGQPIHYDTMIYTNSAGNEYLVNEIQYFISDVKLHKATGDYYLIDEWKDMHYVDTDIPSTHTWEVFDNIAAGDYSKISFIMGITKEKNQSFMFPNPPERDMFWPEYLGGGYHYMKLNGKWKETNGNITPFDFHLGIGQIYYSYPDSITGYVHNAFEIDLPNSSFSIQENETREFTIVMNVENWFQTPNIYDHNIWKGYIMQNQDAMSLACENGHDVFSLEVIK